jgi:hypothetical protein
MANPADRKKWADWLVPISKEIAGLHVNHHTFKRIRQFAHDNPAFGRQGALATNAFWPFLHETFVHYAAVAVRRQCEESKQVISLVRLLKEVAESPHFLTRSGFMASLRLSSDQEAADAFFDKFALGKGATVDSLAVLTDITEIEDACQHLVSYADQRVAHFDKGDIALTIDLSVVEEPIDRLCQTLLRYHYLIRGERFYLDVPGVVDRHLEYLLRDPWRVFES